MRILSIIPHFLHFGAQNPFSGTNGSKACGSNGFLMLFGSFGAKSAKNAKSAKK
jgi:hypothetical protein